MRCAMCKEDCTIVFHNICAPCKQDCEQLMREINLADPIHAVGMMLQSDHYIVVAMFQETVPEKLLRRDDLLLSMDKPGPLGITVATAVFGPENIPESDLFKLIAGLKKA